MPLLNFQQTKKLLLKYKIPIYQTEIFNSEKKAEKFVKKIGYPVVLKIFSLTILHKTDMGGVKMNIKNNKELKKAFFDLIKIKRIEGILVQKMGAGKEIVLGMKRDFQFDHHYETATDGNVVGLGQMGEIPPKSTGHFELAISFASNLELAREKAIQSLADSKNSLGSYVLQWKKQMATLPKFRGFSERSQELFLSSVATLRSLEDKTFAGAFIASPSVPWGLQKKDDSANYSVRREAVGDLLPGAESETAGIGAYHLVWPRDLFQMAQSFIAINDLGSAKASLDHLKHMQFGPEHGDWEYGSRRYSKDGSFVQNAWIHGEAYWRMLQIDQVAYPIMLAHDLWRLQAIELRDYAGMVFRAADFIERFGPWSYQERWEENMGVSPSGIAAQIAALRKAIPMARAMRDESRANAYYKQAERLNNNLETWTFTSSGPVGDGNYFLRVVGASGIQAPWNPDSLSMIPITNGGERLIEKSVLDGGFLELVRHGVRSALDPSVLATLPEYDLSLKDMIEGKPAFRRYVGDRYNWDENSGRQTNGMPWPFLTGERAIYELKAAVMSSNSNETLTQNFLPYANAFESFASSSLMFPEQVWSSGPNQGKGTGAATPLGWAHGEYIQMLKEYNSVAIGAVQNENPSLQ